MSRRYGRKWKCWMKQNAEQGDSDIQDEDKYHKKRK